MVDLIQEHIPHLAQVTPSSSPSELERAQHPAKLLGDKAMLDKSIQEDMERVTKARLAVAEAEDDLSIFPIRLTLITKKMMQGGRGVRVGIGGGWQKKEGGQG